MADVLRPWREVIMPHPDVRAGRYQQAEFAADMAQVLAGEAGPEYGDAAEFFRRTYLTVGMRRLLRDALSRLRGESGDPVIQLKTAFGGGKTHTMLALYHLLRTPAASAEVPAVAELLREAGAPPPTRVAVLVGTALDPQRPSRVLDEGPEVNTLWGEMAYQLAGFRGHQLVADSDYSGTAPGSNTLVELFTLAGPCVVLIDELVAYIRNIKGAKGKPRSGSFNANLTFVQNLTEAVRRSPRALLVASIPESQIEVGDASGEEIARHIENTFGRLEAVWQPVEASESFEVVRRRLFEELTDPRARDRTVTEFGKLYRLNGSDFPTECRETAYEQHIRASYPIHPEVFERLYDDWSAMERFQRTRGVLRLMAKVINVLWETNDRSPLILPGSLPLYDSSVRQELTRYLGDAWNAVVDSDIDGAHAASGMIDAQVPRMDQVQACRRVARAIFMGSVPNKAARGIEDNRVKLGVVQPGEQIAVYADALARLRDTLTYLYSSSAGRYWFAIQPNLNRTVADRASKVDDADVWAELEQRMRRWKAGVGVDFAGVHLAPTGPGDVPDEDRTRLVVLPPRVGHKRGHEQSEALTLARAILEAKGTGPRRYRNMLLFLAADRDALDTLIDETRRYLAWKSVQHDAAALNISDAHQRKQCEDAVAKGDATVTIQLENAYHWLLAPAQEDAVLPPGSAVPIDAVRLSAGGDIGATGTVLQRASYRATTDDHLITRWGPAVVMMTLDRHNLWQGSPHIAVRKLWEYLATYLYLPRLRDKDVLLGALKMGAASTDFFGYAMGMDGQGGYQGLYFGRQPATVYDDEGCMIVSAEAAATALAAMSSGGMMSAGKSGPLAPEAGTPGQPATTDAVPARSMRDGVTTYSIGGATTARADPATEFMGAVALDPLRLGNSAGEVGQAIVQHLASLLGAEITVRLEIHARIPSGVPDKVVRDVTENARTLKFTIAEFE